MPKKVLIQLDCDPQPSTFDAIVAVDAGADVLLRHGGVTPETVVPLVHGGMFTRGGSELASTAVFIGGSDVAAAEAVARRVRGAFFGAVRVGVLVDPAGANTTSGAAVLAVARHLALDRGAAAPCHAVVLGATGPVGARVAALLAGKGCRVTLVSRSRERAERIAAGIVEALPSAGGRIETLEHGCSAFPPGSAAERVLASAEVIIAAGAAGVTLLDEAGCRTARSARVLVDLNAVPPAGIEGVTPVDKARVDGAVVHYGALGVGGIKMKIHKAALARIFADPSAFLGAPEVFAIGEATAATP